MPVSASISITASPSVACFDGMVFRYWKSEHTPPHIHVEIGREKYRFTVPDGVAMDKNTPSQAIKKVKRWFETVVPGTDRRVGELVYDEYLHARHHQAVGQVPTPDQIKVMKRPPKARPQRADPKTGKQRQKNYYAIDHLEVLDGHRLKLWFENGDVKITDVRNALGGEAESPYFAELFENFDKAENIYFGVSWPWPSSKNTYDIKDEDLWGAGVDVAASEPEKQPSLKTAVLSPSTSHR